MTWSMNASGHTPTPDGADNWAEVEKELHAELQAVLSKPKYGATSSNFGGNHVTGAVHVPAVHEPEHAPEHEHAAGHGHHEEPAPDGE